MSLVGNHQKKILVVDDALIIRKMIIELAMECGWEIAGEAKDGQEACDIYKSQKPDLVTMDMVMPNMDGLEALKKIREIDPNARIIMISAVNQKDKLAESIQNGASDFIVKPFDKTRLKALLGKILSE
ncbi:MAG: response regulator [Planctomycetes bacterium]|nr:response regulator [Planctomycetota bacterium]NBY00861.1 response regulator [Planctomycetota bacterium]